MKPNNLRFVLVFTLLDSNTQAHAHSGRDGDTDWQAVHRNSNRDSGSKADGYSRLVKSCSGDAKSAATLLMIEKLEELVKMQVEAIKNLKIDKVTVWDSGNHGKSGTTTANFFSGLMKSLPPLHDIAEMAGLELPKYLGEMKATSDKEKEEIEPPNEPEEVKADS